MAFTLINQILDGKLKARIRNLTPVWYWNNFDAIKRFRRDRPELNPLQKRLISDLRTTGIAMVDVDELFPEGVFDKLKNYTDHLIDKASVNSRKPYFTDLFDTYYRSRNFVLDFENPFIDLSLSRTVLDIANSYLGMYSRFFEYTLAKVTPTNSKPILAQTWHRDGYDKKFLKMFIYLTDVDDESGPFIYVKGSNANGKWHKYYRQSGLSSTYLPEGVVEKEVPKQDIQKCTGKAGRVIFCDTAGIHRGGYCTKNSRIMYTGSYRTPGAPLKGEIIRLYGLPKNLEITNPAIKYAIGYGEKTA